MFWLLIYIIFLYNFNLNLKRLFTLLTGFRENHICSLSSEASGCILHAPNLLDLWWPHLWLGFGFPICPTKQEQRCTHKSSVPSPLYSCQFRTKTVTKFLIVLSIWKIQEFLATETALKRSVILDLKWLRFSKLVITFTGKELGKFKGARLSWYFRVHIPEYMFSI